MIKNFNDQKICCGIPQEKFRNVNFSSRLSGTLDSSGVLRSKFCRTISEKNIVCVKCLYLKKYLSKKLREVEVKIPISKDKKNKCKLDEKQINWILVGNYKSVKRKTKVIYFFKSCQIFLDNLNYYLFQGCL